MKDAIRPLLLRENQAVLILDAKQRLKYVYCLRNERVLWIEWVKGKQKVKTLYLEDLAATLQDKGLL